MKKSYWIIGLMIIIAASLIGWFYIFKPNDKNEKNIQTAEVVRRDIGSTVLATGIIKPQVGAEVKVGSRISGIVKKLRSEERRVGKECRSRWSGNEENKEFRAKR